MLARARLSKLYIILGSSSNLALLLYKQINNDDSFTLRYERVVRRRFAEVHIAEAQFVEDILRRVSHCTHTHTYQKSMPCAQASTILENMTFRTARHIATPLGCLNTVE